MRASSASALVLALMLSTGFPAESSDLDDEAIIDAKSKDAQVRVVPSAPKAPGPNDTSIAGDQFETDTEHVEDFGTIDMEFEMEPQSEGAQPSNAQRPATRRHE